MIETNQNLDPVYIIETAIAILVDLQIAFDILSHEDAENNMLA